MTPEQEEQVRRALASAPPVGAMPPEVAARLDATLAGLVAERSGDATTGSDGAADPAPVVPLEERRRRRWPRLLVAAAAVSVVAYGVGTSLGGFPVTGGSAESTAARDETFAGAGAGADTDSLAPEEAPKVVEGHPGKVRADGSRVLARKLLVTGTVRLHSGSLREDVQRLLDRTHAGALDAREPVPTNGRNRPLAGLAVCEQPDTARGDRVAAARLDGRRATLVLRKPADGTRVAEVYSCGDGSRLLALTRVRSGG